MGFGFPTIVPCFALYTPNPRNRIRNFIDFSRLVVGVEASSGSRASGARDIRFEKKNCQAKTSYTAAI
nr:hypothetical protein CFP56_74619 [Quercus suber]